MKKLLFCAVIFLMMQSCFTTQLVSKQSELRERYLRTDVEDVEYDFGQPDREADLRNGGFTYTYYGNGHSGDGMEYTRFSFDKDGYVRGVQSNVMIRKRVFSGGKTAGLIIILVAADLLVTALIISASESGY